MIKGLFFFFWWFLKVKVGVNYFKLLILYFINLLSLLCFFFVNKAM